MQKELKDAKAEIERLSALPSVPEPPNDAPWYTTPMKFFRTKILSVVAVTMLVLVSLGFVASAAVSCTTTTTYPHPTTTTTRPCPTTTTTIKTTTTRSE